MRYSGEFNGRRIGRFAFRPLWQSVSIAASFKETTFKKEGTRERYWPSPQSSPAGTGFASRDRGWKKKQRLSVQVDVRAAQAGNYCTFAPTQVIAHAKKKAAASSPKLSKRPARSHRCTQTPANLLCRHFQTQTCDSVAQMNSPEIITVNSVYFCLLR